ncbi:hypothetical protein XU18_0048 [Perkinsela sp. CCAP 1560/4]|nr:hypothetical protein XU18_0048 [Perkinsela sp. CCAP 1560/4]|eukprot:KNH09363.1 hypothetical protein XU18_0048 [Perkinsela sp. CCAP 1560/4]
MAAGAHSYEAWADFTNLYSTHYKRHPPFDYFVLASFEKCNSLKRAHAEVRSYSVGSIDGVRAAKNLQAADVEVRNFISNGLQSLSDSGVNVHVNHSERVGEIIVRSSLYFRSMFLSTRYLWVHLLSKSSEKLSGETYEFLLSTCGMYNRQETLVSVDAMLEQVSLYWQHYLRNAEKPYSSDVLFAVLMAYSSCNHKETARLAAGMLELKLSSLYKKEILKCALYAAANQQDIEAFCTLEEYCIANVEYLGEMKIILMRRRAHLLSHHPDDEILKFYRELPAAMGDRYTTDIVFRWLEQRSNFPGYLLQSVYLAEELWQNLELDTKSPSSIQLECMMAIYAKAADRKGIRLYRKTPVEIITQKSIIEVLRILCTYGYHSGSKGDAEDIWKSLPHGMYKMLERDAASREVVMRFHTSENDSYDLTKLWFNQKTFDPSQCTVESPIGSDPSRSRWDPIHPVDEVTYGLRCQPSEYIHGGVWDWG